MSDTEHNLTSSKNTTEEKPTQKEGADSVEPELLKALPPEAKKKT